MLELRIKELRKEVGLSQEKLGEFLFKTQQAVAKWEKGIAEPDSEAINKMSDLFNVSTDYLLGKTDIPRYEVPDGPEVEIHPVIKDALLGFHRGGGNFTQEEIDRLGGIIETAVEGIKAMRNKQEGVQP